MFRFLMNLIRRQPRVSRAHINAVLATTNVDKNARREWIAR
jgi:hypothetical protein